MVEEIKCDSGVHALAQYRVIPAVIYSTGAFSSLVNVYLSSYQTVGAETKWALNATYHSDDAFAYFASAPDNAVGIFTLFPTKEEKLAHFNDPKLLTYPFANVAIDILYRLDSFSKATKNAVLRVTPDILGGIYSGSIVYWNDTQIQVANLENKQFLPYEKIMVVVRGVASDTNSLFLSFLSNRSTQFRDAFPPELRDDYRTANFSSKIPHTRLTSAASSSEIDMSVAFYDGSIGYFLRVNSPTSRVADFCLESDCGMKSVNDVPKSIKADATSIEACMADPEILVYPSSNVHSYDLTVSRAQGCYPMAATVDYTTYKPESKSCPEIPLTKTGAVVSSGFDEPVIFTRIKFGEWLFDGDEVVKPLVYNGISPSTMSDRATAHTSICDIECSSLALGYSFCGYRDCNVLTGDYTQTVSACDSASSTRTVSYALNGDAVCIEPIGGISNVAIQCTFTPYSSSLGAFQLALCALSVALCSCILGMTFHYRRQKVLKRSQLIFVYLFLTGTILTSLAIIVLTGPNTDSTCLARPWYFNLSATIMFAPLIMKLQRVDAIFNSKMKKITITNTQVLATIAMIISVDIIILILWSAIDTPRMIYVSNTYPSVFFPVEDPVCNTGLSNPFEIAILTFKMFLLLFAVMKAVRTWSIPSDISEAKTFAVAIYNIGIIGGIGYFLGALLGSNNATVGVTLRCIGISVSASSAALLIMLPKFYDIYGTEIQQHTLLRGLLAFCCRRDAKVGGKVKYIDGVSSTDHPSQGSQSKASVSIVEEAVPDETPIINNAISLPDQDTH